MTLSRLPEINTKPNPFELFAIGYLKNLDSCYLVLFCGTVL